MRKYTPGPWRYYHQLRGKNTAYVICSVDLSNCRVASIRANALGLGEGEPEGNARLIAAAPDLLAALKRVAQLSLGGDEVEREVRAAILKAEGDSKC